MTPGIPYIATVGGEGPHGCLIMRIVCVHCADEHEAEIDPLDYVRHLREPGRETMTEGLAGLALVAVWIATHTTGHAEELRRGVAQ